MPTILGLGGSDHDVHACLIADDRVVVGIEEERLSRKKYGLGGNLLDGLARRYCLEHERISLDAVDQIVVDEILAPTAGLAVRKRAVRVDHHLAHAASSFFTSPFDSAAVVVVDNAGGLVEDEQGAGLQATSWYRAEGRQIRLLGRVLSRKWHEGKAVLGEAYQRGDGDDSLGHLYKKVTGSLGFKYPREAKADPTAYFFPEDGITMGLSAFGDDRFVEEMWSLVRLERGGGYRIPLMDGRFDALLAKWLPPDAGFATRAAAAAAAQEVLTRVLMHIVRHVLESTGETNLCLAGGVAMNSVANGRIFRESGVKSLYVPPTPGDNGTGIGAALLAVSRRQELPMPKYTVYSGRSYGSSELEAAVRRAGAAITVEEVPEAALLQKVASNLFEGKVVAWFEGPSEAGRRALGHRSLLCDPRTKAAKDHLNERVKHREWFRPFAPFIAEERTREYFEMDQPTPYMQIVVRIRPDKVARIEGVAHVDGTARLQTIREDQHRRWYKLLGEFERLSGVPVLLNTSFNVAGEPIVETPDDAISCFLGTNIDHLVLENLYVSKRGTDR